MAYNWMSFMLVRNVAKELPSDKKNLLSLMGGMAGPNLPAAMPAITLAQREVAVQDKAEVAKERDVALVEKAAAVTALEEAEVKVGELQKDLDQRPPAITTARFESVLEALGGKLGVSEEEMDGFMATASSFLKSELLNGKVIDQSPPVVAIE